MTCVELDELRLRAADRCEICRISAVQTGHGMLHIDHDPRLGQWAVRGLLCSPCNSRLQHGVAWNAAAERYLENPFRAARTVPDHSDQELLLKVALAEYRQFIDARRKLTEAVRAAHADGIRQRDILRATDHVWTREQVRRVCRE
jgi:hypothetical protein